MIRTQHPGTEKYVYIRFKPSNIQVVCVKLSFLKPQLLIGLGGKSHSLLFQDIIGVEHPQKLNYVKNPPIIIEDPNWV